MKTVLKIPHKPAPADPEWLLKAHSGRKMDPIEIEQYLVYKFDLDHKKLLQDRQMEGIPGFGSIGSVIRNYHYLKKDCMHSFRSCGSRYNRAAYFTP